MYTFLICGIVLLLYAWMRFKRRVFYPSVIFCFMWGMNCIFHYLIYIGYVTPLNEIGLFDYQYMKTYIIYFTIATLLGFSLAHRFSNGRNIHSNISLEFMDNILRKYKWVMWLNFWGGIFRIVALVSLIGFSFSNIIDYRLAANDMMMFSQGSLVGWIFRLTAYVNMLAIMYVALSGLRAGMSQLNMKDALTTFILFAPVQLATGGRLFILYFIIFYFGCFLLGRGINMQNKARKWLMGSERKAIINMMIIMLPLVVAISLSRGDGGVANISKHEGSFLDSFSYISDGTMTTNQCMEFFDGGSSLTPQGGKTTFLGNSSAADAFRTHKHYTNYASSVYCIIHPLFLDFGYYGSLIAWTILAFFMELIALKSLAKMNLIRFVVYAMLLKMCYESVLANPFAGNIPFFELIVLFTIFYKPIFGKLERGASF